MHTKLPCKSKARVRCTHGLTWCHKLLCEVIVTRCVLHDAGGAIGAALATLAATSARRGANSPGSRQPGRSSLLLLETTAALLPGAHSHLRTCIGSHRAHIPAHQGIVNCLGRQRELQHRAAWAIRAAGCFCTVTRGRW